MGFSFSATARCGLCGEYLSSSDEECDHKGQTPVENMFRRVSRSGETPYVVSVRACPGFHWHALKDAVSEDWIAYQWLGPKGLVKKLSDESIDDVPHRAMSTRAPEEVEEYAD